MKKLIFIFILIFSFSIKGFVKPPQALVSEWYIVPYIKKFDTSLGDSVRFVGIDSALTSQIKIASGDWSEIEQNRGLTVNGKAVVKVLATQAQQDLLDDDFYRFPVRALTASLASLSSAEKTEFINNLLDAGYLQAEIEAEFGNSPNSFAQSTFLDLLNFTVSKRIIGGIDRGPQKPISLVENKIKEPVSEGSILSLLNYLFSFFMPASPTTGVIDNFTDTNGVNLDAHTPDAGGSWVLVQNTAEIQSNEATTANSDNWGWAHYSSTFGPDTESYIDVASKTTVIGVGFLARMTTDVVTTTDGYMGWYKPDAGGTDVWQFYRVDNGSFTQLGSNELEETAVGDQVFFEVIGTTLRLYKNGTEVGSGRTDATYSSAGKIGIRVRTTNCDVFGGGTIPSVSRRKWIF